jgi:hypothetical protein
MKNEEKKTSCRKILKDDASKIKNITFSSRETEEVKRFLTRPKQD